MAPNDPKPPWKTLLPSNTNQPPLSPKLSLEDLQRFLDTQKPLTREDFAAQQRSAAQQPKPQPVGQANDNIRPPGDLLRSAITETKEYAPGANKPPTSAPQRQLSNPPEGKPANDNTRTPPVRPEPAQPAAARPSLWNRAAAWTGQVAVRAAGRSNALFIALKPTPAGDPKADEKFKQQAEEFARERYQEAQRRSEEAKQEQAAITNNIKNRESIQERLKTNGQALSQLKKDLSAQQAEHRQEAHEVTLNAMHTWQTKSKDRCVPERQLAKEEIEKNFLRENAETTTREAMQDNFRNEGRQYEEQLSDDYLKAAAEKVAKQAQEIGQNPRTLADHYYLKLNEFIQSEGAVKAISVDGDIAIAKKLLDAEKSRIDNARNQNSKAIPDGNALIDVFREHSPVISGCKFTDRNIYSEFVKSEALQNLDPKQNERPENAKFKTQDVIGHSMNVMRSSSKVDPTLPSSPTPEPTPIPPTIHRPTIER